MYFVGSYKVYTCFFSGYFFGYYHLCYLNMYIDSCRFLTFLSEGVILTSMCLCSVYTNIDDASPLSNLSRREINTHVLRSYCHNIWCIFGVTVAFYFIIVRYKLNRLWYLRVESVWYFSLLVWQDTTG